VTAPAAAPVLRLEGICKSFRRATGEAVLALDNMSFSIVQGVLAAVVGPDGAGKTTLLRLMAGLVGAVGMGLFVSSIAETMQQAMLYAFLLVMPFALLSGLTTPFNSMPESLQAAMIVNPLRYALDITKRVYLEDAGFAQLLADFVPLTIIGLLTLAGAAWLFRRRLI
jgi:ABC-2 type transport system permease protein